MRERRRRHDDVHHPLQGRGKRASRTAGGDRPRIVAGNVRCDCCGRPAPRTRGPSQEWGICDECVDAGCCSKCDGEGGMLRGARCPLVVAGSDVVMCLHCDRPLHRSEPLTFVDNTNPGLGGCHADCVDAYHAQREKDIQPFGGSGEE